MVCCSISDGGADLFRFRIQTAQNLPKNDGFPLGQPYEPRPA
ncbi:hypothetical protein Z950_484 [Sulfitobacter mediterraneus KCTC 32188]|nr:hypothetical protein Z950_484 [Sulfitobacter mediterraneus KCTC 32188]